jgi:hypothetical protein
MLNSVWIRKNLLEDLPHIICEHILVRSELNTLVSAPITPSRNTSVMKFETGVLRGAAMEWEDEWNGNEGRKTRGKDKIAAVGRLRSCRNKN